MQIFPKDKVKPGEILTEKDYESAATKALIYSILGWILSGGLIGILMEAYVFRYVDRAKKSSNPDVIQRALTAKKIAMVYWGLISAGILFIPYLIFIDSNIILSIISGITTITIVGGIVWFQKKQIWSKKKLAFVMASLAIYALLASFYAFAIKGDTVDPQSKNDQNIIEIDFKNLSSDEVINEINKLPASAQVAAYKKHSALEEETWSVWEQNLQGKDGKDFKATLQKSLPTLISQGWTENSARDILLWMFVKSSIIVLRPGGGCQGNDCPKSDQEIAEQLKAESGLSMKIINSIFQELAIDRGGT